MVVVVLLFCKCWHTQERVQLRIFLSRGIISPNCYCQSVTRFTPNEQSAYRYVKVRIRCAVTFILLVYLDQDFLNKRCGLIHRCRVDNVLPVLTWDSVFM